MRAIGSSGRAAHSQMTRGSARSAIVALGVCFGLFGGCMPAASPTATPPPSAAVSSPSSSASGPSAAPSKPPPQAAIQAFVDRVSEPGFSYTATLSGGSRHSTDILPIKGTLAVSGADYALVANFTFPDERVTAKVEQRYVGRVGWVRFHPGKWQKLKAFGEDDVLSPFVGVLAPSDVTLLETLPNKTFRVRISALLLHPSLIPAFNVTEERVERSRLDLVIDQRGRPLSGAWQLHGTARVSGQLQEVVMELTVKFARVGGQVTVRAP
jgi:hypothetical protein